MVFGNVGAGKSTLLNWMLRRYAKKLETKYKEFLEENIETLHFDAF